jgi:hypothetical protein
MTTCGFNEAWIGACKEPVAEETRCAKHAGKTCASCGAPATKNCDETMGPLVCGCDLCAECEHTTHPNGCNSGSYLPDDLKGHCKPSEQRFRPWYANGAEEHNERVIKSLGFDSVEAWDKAKRAEWRVKLDAMVRRQWFDEQDAKLLDGARNSHLKRSNK